jgi:hypothetical protein
MIMVRTLDEESPWTLKYLDIPTFNKILNTTMFYEELFTSPREVKSSQTAQLFGKKL